MSQTTFDQGNKVVHGEEIGAKKDEKKGGNVSVQVRYWN
jgi:hypothetical protein